MLSQDRKEKRTNDQVQEEHERIHQADEMERLRDPLKRGSKEMVSESHCSHRKYCSH